MTQEVDKKSVKFESAGPVGSYDKIFRCFKDKGNGLLFRLVHEKEQKWSFYNDTKDTVMKIRATFNSFSKITVLGNAKNTTPPGKEAKPGEINVELEVAPGATEPFISGTVNGFSIGFQTEAFVPMETIRFENGKPSVSYDKIFPCFKNNGNGLLFRLVDNKSKTWYFYNDTPDFMMKCTCEFEDKGRIKVLGNAKGTANGNALSVALEIKPGATEEFIQGDAGTYRIAFNAEGPAPFQPLMSPPIHQHHIQTHHHHHHHHRVVHAMHHSHTAPFPAGTPSQQPSTAGPTSYAYPCSPHQPRIEAHSVLSYAQQQQPPPPTVMPYGGSSSAEIKSSSNANNTVSGFRRASDTSPHANHTGSIPLSSSSGVNTHTTTTTTTAGANGMSSHSYTSNPYNTSWMHAVPTTTTNASPLIHPHVSSLMASPPPSPESSPSLPHAASNSSMSAPQHEGTPTYTPAYSSAPNGMGNGGALSGVIAPNHSIATDYPPPSPSANPTTPTENSYNHSNNNSTHATSTHHFHTNHNNTPTTTATSSHNHHHHHQNSSIGIPSFGLSYLSNGALSNNNNTNTPNHPMATISTSSSGQFYASPHPSHHSNPSLGTSATSTLSPALATHSMSSNQHYTRSFPGPQHYPYYPASAPGIPYPQNTNNNTTHNTKNSGGTTHSTSVSTPTTNAPDMSLSYLMQILQQNNEILRLLTRSRADLLLQSQQQEQQIRELQRALGVQEGINEWKELRLQQLMEELEMRREDGREDRPRRSRRRSLPKSGSAHESAAHDPETLRRCPVPCNDDAEQHAVNPSSFASSLNSTVDTTHDGSDRSLRKQLGEEEQRLMGDKPDGIPVRRSSSSVPPVVLESTLVDIAVGAHGEERHRRLDDSCGAEAPLLSNRCSGSGSDPVPLHSDADDVASTPAAYDLEEPNVALLSGDGAVPAIHFIAGASTSSVGPVSGMSVSCTTFPLLSHPPQLLVVPPAAPTPEEVAMREAMDKAAQYKIRHIRTPQDATEVLFWLCQAYHYRPSPVALRRCVDVGACVTITGPDSDLPILTWFIAEGHVDLVEICLDSPNPIDFTVVGSRGNTPLHAICMSWLIFRLFKKPPEQVASLLNLILDRQQRTTQDKGDWGQKNKYGHDCISEAAHCGYLSVFWEIVRSRQVPYFVHHVGLIRLTCAVHKEDWDRLQTDDQEGFELVEGFKWHS